MNPPKYSSYDNVDLDEPNNLKYPIPDKLYKYTRIHNAKDLLYDNIIYLPEITELNDPYEGELLYNYELLENTYFKSKKEEFDKEILGETGEDYEKDDLYFALRERVLKKQSKTYLEELKKYLHEGIYFICLSSTNKSNSLWVHYANNHKGICIEYNLNHPNYKYFRDLCFKVEYVKKSDDTKELKTHIKNNKYSRNFMLKPFLRKSEEWNYEKEWRIILTEYGILHNKGFNPYKPYINFIKPIKVHMGLNISIKNENIIKEICEIKNIPLCKAKKTNKSYDFDFEDIQLQK